MIEFNTSTTNMDVQQQQQQNLLVIHQFECDLVTHTHTAGSLF